MSLSGGAAGRDRLEFATGQEEWQPVALGSVAKDRAKVVLAQAEEGERRILRAQRRLLCDGDVHEEEDVQKNGPLSLELSMSGMTPQRLRTLITYVLQLLTCL